MEKEEIINLIKGRIEDECRKHGTLDWPRIAAIKIYTQWFEYFNNQNQELKEEMADKKYTEEDIIDAVLFGMQKGLNVGKVEETDNDWVNNYVRSINK